jgi:hypothetical protein
MFQSSAIIRELVLNLVKVIFTLKHSVKLRRYLLCGCVAACHAVACVLCRMQTLSHSAQHTTHTPFHDMLPHNSIINNDVIFNRMFQRKYNFSQVQYKLPDDGRRPKHLGAVFSLF